MVTANVIPVGNIASFDMIAFPEQHMNNNVYMYNQFQNFTQSLTDVGKTFLAQAKMYYDKANDSSVIKAAKAAIRSVKGMFHPNMIVPLESVEELQAAQSVMQRYIMAEETIRTLYHKQRCDGYSDSYVDFQPGVVGEQHYDYRRVMNSIVQDIEEADGSDNWVSHNYLDTIYEGDRELELVEQCDIIKTWSAVRRCIEECIDPTNVLGGTL